MKKLLLLLLTFLISKPSFSQSWQEMMQEPGRNFYEIQKAFNEYWKDKDKTEKGRGYKPFKRWENFISPRVYPSGDLSLISTTWSNYELFTKQNTTGSKSTASSSSPWIAIGPLGPLTGSVFGVPAKTGRDNFITFDPTNSNTYWCGSPAGGLWKTTNNGSTWVTNTDNLTVIGCSDVAIDPTNTNIMYLATGDGEGNGDTYSIGVLKSIDGGLTWNPTGLVFTVNQQKQMRRVVVNPLNPQIVIAVGNFGIQRSSNGGTTWTQIQPGNFYDVEFKSGHPNVVFAAGNLLFRSVNAGLNFTQITTTNGIPGGSNRMNVAVTPADTNYVYVLASKSSNTGLLGVYRSTDGGVNFTTMSTTPDILSNPCNASATGGQGWYDLAFAVSPLNKDEVVVGGVNVWRSTNGGVNYTNIGCWNSTNNNPPFVHADQHELEYTPNGTLYVTNDGGVSEHIPAGGWIDHTAPRNISQIYKIGLSTLTPSLWITGHQDNGTNIYTGTTYKASYGGDGMDCFIDRTNDNNMFASLYNGGFRKSSNGGLSWSAATNGLTGAADWVCPWKQDPMDPNTLYAGYSQLFVSTDLGNSWNPTTNNGGGGYVVEFAIAPSNNQIIYVIQGASIRKTIDAGNTWSNVTANIPANSAAPTFITIHPTDPNKVWVTLSGYSAANKVYQTTNGGVSWTNITSNLPNLPTDCSVYQSGTNDRIYVGMDVGVYTKDNSSTTWTLYNTNLPNVPVHDMEISPAAPTLLRAATYGRGVYQVNVIQATTVPASAFSFVGTICAGVSKNFIDNSSEDPTSWIWSVSPSTGVTISSSSAENPSITFQTGGSYTVSLTSSNGFGSGAMSTQVINVSASPVLSLTTSSGNSTVCVGDDVTLTAAGATSYSWLPTTKTGSTLNFTAAISNALTYTVNAKDANGCVGTETLALLVSDCTGISGNSLENTIFNVFPNPASNYISITNHAELAMDVPVVIEDISGKIVLKQTAHFKKGKSEVEFNISSLANGVYIIKLKTDKGDSIIKFVKEH